MALIIKDKKNMLNESALQPNTIQWQKRQKGSPKYNIYGASRQKQKSEHKMQATLN